jgi:hypothetical protein
MSPIQYTTKKSSTANQHSFLPVAIACMAFVFTLAMITMNAVYADSSGKGGTSIHSDHLTTLKAVGRGEFTWFGISVYQASLWTRNGRFTNIQDSMPVALAITYQKDIDGEALTERTIEEWERLGIFSEQERITWRQKLKQIWPDVKPGDNITTLVTSESTTRFYFNDKLLAVLDDPSFGAALLSIWLHPDTSEPGLRDSLLGKREDLHE